MDKATTPSAKALYQQLIDNVDEEIKAKVDNLFYNGTVDKIDRLIRQYEQIIGYLCSNDERVNTYKLMINISKVILETVKTNLDVVKHFRYEIINFKHDNISCLFASLVHLYCAIKGDPSSLKCYRIEHRGRVRYLVNSEYKYVNNTLKKRKSETIFDVNLDDDRLEKLALDLYAKI